MIFCRSKGSAPNLNPGDPCPTLCGGRLYELSITPGGIIRIYGQSSARVVSFVVVGSLTPVSQWLSCREGLTFNSSAKYRSAMTSIRGSEFAADTISEIIVGTPNPLDTKLKL